VITVLMATRDRAGILARVLDAYTRLAAPPGGWEVLVVDNGSSDGTADLVRGFAGRLPVTLVSEPRAGKTRALNAGLERVTGDLILFTDDDILPPAGWLTEYVAAAADRPEFDLFSGPVLLNWPGEPPAWAVSNKLVKDWCFAHWDPPQETGPFEGLLLGGNFAVRTRAQLKIGGFDPELGPAPGYLTMGDETEFIQRLRAAGCKTWWIRNAAVEHIIRPDQIDKKWMLHRAVRAGSCRYRESVAEEGLPSQLFGLPRWVIRIELEQLCRLVGAWLRRNEQDAFLARWHLNFFGGMLMECWRGGEMAKKG
jgi:glycosyltransferase involved in cell wall biosynthesis